MNLFMKQKQSGMQKTNLGLPGDGGINWKIGTDIYTLIIYIKQITNKDLLYSKQNATQYSVKAYMEKESKKEWV